MKVSNILETIGNTPHIRVQRLFGPDAEVWINGRSHKLEDVVQGDKVTVYGYRDKSSSEVKLIASKIEVTRPEGTDWKKPDKSAAAPQSGGSTGVTADSGGEK